MSSGAVICGAHLLEHARQHQTEAEAHSKRADDLLAESAKIRQAVQARIEARRAARKLGGS
jgi:hypothetical protein